MVPWQSFSPWYPATQQLNFLRAVKLGWSGLTEPALDGQVDERQDLAVPQPLRGLSNRGVVARRGRHVVCATQRMAPSGNSQQPTAKRQTSSASGGVHPSSRRSWCRRWPCSRCRSGQPCRPPPSEGRLATRQSSTDGDLISLARLQRGKQLPRESRSSSQLTQAALTT